MRNCISPNLGRRLWSRYVSCSTCMQTHTNTNRVAIAHVWSLNYIPKCDGYTYIPYSQKIWWFGGLSRNRQIKNPPIFRTCIYIRTCMAIPYWPAKFKYANTFAMVIWGPTAEFNSRQYFRLYGTIILLAAYPWPTVHDSMPRTNALGNYQFV